MVFDPDEYDKVKAPPSPYDKFPYDESRECLEEGSWPSKTKCDCSDTRQKCGCSVLTIPFSLSKKGKSKISIQLEMLDLPGERVADFPMLGRSYREWCEWMEKASGCSASGTFKNCMNEIASLFEGVDKKKAIGKKDKAFQKYKDEAIQKYKDYLVNEYASLALSITPSTVKLGRDGKQRTGKKDEFKKELDNAPVGLSEESQFIPLPGKCLTKDSPCRNLVKDFEKGYEEYKKSIMAPIASWCKHANSLLYFVDVLSILQRGPGVYNSELEFARQALGFFKHRKSSNPLIKAISGVKDLFVTHIDNCYVVVPKSDRVLKDDREKMRKLAEDMTSKPRSIMGLGNDNIGVYTCAAVDTSETYGEEHAIKAIIKEGGGAGNF